MAKDWEEKEEKFYDMLANKSKELSWEKSFDKMFVKHKLMAKGYFGYEAEPIKEFIRETLAKEKKALLTKLEDLLKNEKTVREPEYPRVAYAYPNIEDPIASRERQEIRGSNNLKVIRNEFRKELRKKLAKLKEMEKE